MAQKKFLESEVIRVQIEHRNEPYEASTENEEAEI